MAKSSSKMRTNREVDRLLSKARKLARTQIKAKARKSNVYRPVSAQVAPISYHQANSPDFLQSFEWRKVRMIALKRDGARCACCGASPSTGAVMHVDHIKPRRARPDLALDADNLQVLCAECNHGKGSWDQTDWRTQEPELTPEQKAHMDSIF